MATDNATTTPVRGQAYQFTVVFYDTTTGNPISGSLTSLSLTVSKDGAAYAAATGSITDIGGGTALVVLSAADMSCRHVRFLASCSNANAKYPCEEVHPADLRRDQENWLSQTNLRMEQGLVQSIMYTTEGTEREKVSPYRVLVRDETGALRFTRTTSETANAIVFGRMVKVA